MKDKEKICVEKKKKKQKKNKKGKEKHAVSINVDKKKDELMRTIASLSFFLATLHFSTIKCIIPLPL